MDWVIKQKLYIMRVYMYKRYPIISYTYIYIYHYNIRTEYEIVLCLWEPKIVPRKL